MNPDGSSDQPNPFGPFPFLGDLAKALGNQGPLNWELAQQFAALGAVGDSADIAPDPSVRFEYADLARIADFHVRELTALSTDPGGTATEILTCTRAMWAQRTLSDFRPLFHDLATALSRREDTPPSDDPFGSMLGNLSGMMAPALLGMSIGSMVGALAQRAFGQYDLPLPRVKTDELLLVPSSIENFADEWSISKNDARMWVLIHELTSHAILSTPAAQAGVTALVKQHVAAFRPDPTALMDRLSNLDMNDASALEEMQRVFSDPTVLMGAVRTREQENLAPLLEAHVSAVIAYIDHVVDAVSARILGGGGHIAEAVRRRRLDTGPDAVFVEHLLGLKLTRQQLSRGSQFIAGVRERTNDDSILQTLVARDGCLPTPNEIDAPGLWLARIELN